MSTGRDYDGLIEGIELAIELETVILDHLRPDYERWKAARVTDDPPTLVNIRRVRQFIDSKALIKGWRQDIIEKQILRDHSREP